MSHTSTTVNQKPLQKKPYKHHQATQLLPLRSPQILTHQPLALSSLKLNVFLQLSYKLIVKRGFATTVMNDFNLATVVNVIFFFS